ncbi:cation:proton antiporter domain-containing protein [Rhodococcus erythropolis]|uniref:cation:proton antiporter domain-containing protein n=1 Tax=Rhodococcus erythropolis TaxID=1833 RepID=UPI001D171E2F|nr:cation:proton antiporter [Rhodococcus erythropolis]
MIMSTMITVLLITTGPPLIWAACARRLQRFSVNGPLLMVVLGGIAGWFVADESAAFFDSKLALYLAEVILALLLFVDATDVPGSLRSHATSVPLRLLAVALPLSLILIMAIGLSLPLGLSAAGVLAITCVAVPVDFSPQLSIIKDTRIPPSVRRWLGIESGYNDGLISPLLLAALALASTTGDPGDQALAAFLTAAPAGGIAVIVGALIGTVAGWAFRTAARAQWCDIGSTRIGVLALPLFTFAVAVTAHGNGFVAAFVCGVAFRIALSARGNNPADKPGAEFSLADDVAGVVNLQLWLAFGIAGISLVVSNVNWWPALVLAVCVVTVGRILPVLIALIASPAPWRDRIFMAVMGPHGAASIVFGLIAYNALPNEDGEAVLAAACIIVLSSLVLHGLGASRVISLLYGRIPNHYRDHKVDSSKPLHG